MSSTTCDLCGLPLRYASVDSTNSGTVYHFCCQGCRQVFTILYEAAGSADPEDFRQSELFKSCLAAGIIPTSEQELSAAAADDPPNFAQNTADQGKELLDLALTVSGMWCPACAWVIEKTLSRLPGIGQAGCDFSSDRLQCRYDPLQVSPTRIHEHIRRLGYGVQPAADRSADAAAPTQWTPLALAAFLTMNVMMLSFALYSGFFTRLSSGAVTKLSWPLFFLASVVFFYCGTDIHRRAWRGIRHGAYGMETLISLGASVTYLYSVFNFYRGSIHLYFDTSSMLITLVLLGKAIEGRAKARVQRSLNAFFSLKPRKARICSRGLSRGHYVAADRLQAGDLFRLVEGEISPADGVVMDGSSRIDESSVTGEPREISKTPGDRVISGSRVTWGDIRIRATQTGADSILGQMMGLMEKAVGRKTPLEGKTDRLLRWFVPAVVLLSAGTGALYALAGSSVETCISRSVAVMVISCPCALGIAIPLARLGGISAALKKGLLVRDFSCFEQAERLNIFVFDKTGTITTGQWTLQRMDRLGDISKQRALALAAALEKNVDHPIAFELRRQAELRRVSPWPGIENVRVHQAGVTGAVAGRKVRIGSSRFTAGTENAPHRRPDRQNGFVSTVYLTIDKKPAAAFVFGDELRSSSLQTIRTLHRRGCRTILVSGDSRRATAAVARRARIPQFCGQRLPADKATLVHALKRGGCVAMIGDGINDAPAMVEADLSFAVHSRSRLAGEAAQVTLMRGEPGQLTDFLRLARRVNRKIFQNLVWSLGYNLISIPVAMSGLLSPLVAVSAMLLSSLSVIGNTLTLLRPD